MIAAPALSVRGLSKSFGALVVAQAIDLDLALGARVALIGPNGAKQGTVTHSAQPMVTSVPLSGQRGGNFSGTKKCHYL